MLDNGSARLPGDRSPAAGQARARLPWKKTRRFLWLGVCATGLLLLLAHAPFVRGWVLQGLTSWVGPRYGVTVNATGLHYNLLTLSASIDECRIGIGAGEQQSEPTVFAQHVKVVFGRGVLTGRPDLRTLSADVVGVRVWASGKTARAGTTSPSRAFEIPGLTAQQIEIRRFSFDYVDPDGLGELSIRGGSLHLQGGALQRLEGRFGLAAVSLDNETFRVRTGRVEGRVAIDANGIAVEPSRIDAGGDTLRGVGRIAMTPTGGEFDLALEGSLAMNLLAEWFPALSGGTGRLLARARVTGPLAEPQARLNVETAGLTWPTLALPASAAEAVIGRAGIEVSRFRVFSPPAGLVASGTLRFEGAARSVARVRWDGISPTVLARVLRTRSRGVPPMRTSGTADLAWAGLVPSLATLGGTLSADVIGPAGGEDAGTVRVSATPQQWHIAARQPLAEGTAARLDALLAPDPNQFSRSAVAGSLEVGVRDVRQALERLHRLGGPEVKIPAAIDRAPLEISAALSGSVGRPRAAGLVRSSDLRVTRLGTVTGEAAFETTPDGLTVERLHAVDSRGTVVDARGTVAYSTLACRGSFEATASTQVLEGILPGNWTAAGSIDARGTWNGTLRNPAAEVQVTGRGVALNGLPPGPLAATASLADGVVHVEASVQELAAKVSGQLVVSEPFAFEASTALENTNLARLAALAPARAELPAIQGAVTAGVDISGTLAAPDVPSTRMRLIRLDARVGDHPLVLAAPSDIYLSQSEVSIAGLRLESGSAALVADGRLGKSATGALNLTIDTPAAEAAHWFDGAFPGTRLTAVGTLRAEVRVTGAIGAASLGGRAATALENVTVGDRKVAENVRAAIELRGDRVEASRITGTVLGGTIDISASAPTEWVGRYLRARLTVAQAPGGLAQVKGRVTVPTASLLDWQHPGGAAGAAGMVTVTIDASASQPTLGAVVGTATILTDQAAVQDVPVSLERPAVLAVRSGRLFVEDAEVRARGASVGLRGHVALTSPFDVDLRLKTSGSLGFLGAAIPARATGSIDADLRVSGPAGALSAAGAVTLQQAGLVIPASRIALTDWSGRLDFTSASLTALDVNGLVNGGTATLRGRLPLADATRDPSTLSLSVRDAFVEVVKGFKSQVDADLDVGHLQDGFRVGGAVTVVSGAYREPVTAMAALFEGTPSSSARPASHAGALDRVSLDVKLLARTPIIVDNSLGRVDLVPDMRLTGTAARPVLTGSLDALRGGHVTLAGRQYRIREGQALFTQREGLVPRVNLSAETRVGEYTISIRASGPVNAIETSATSTPPLSDRDLRSLLVTGRTAGLTGESQDDRQFALEAASSEILGFAGQMVGLDSLQLGRADFDIASTNVNPATRLTVTKSLGERFRVILSENLDDNKLTWIIVLDSRRGYEFRLSQRDEGEHVVEFRQELEFGPGTSPARAPARKRDAASPRVSRVDFSGTPGMPASDLQQVIWTRAGRPFDVEAWQADRERLEGFYRKKGYATARVVPRRTVTDTGRGERVDVEYHIDRGPRTVLRIEGWPVPDAVVDDILTAWTESVLPDLLRDESIRLVRRHLADRNHLQASIEFSVDQPSDTMQRVTLRVSPGPAVRSKRVVFEAEVSDADIKARPALRAALAGAWVDTEALLDEVQTLYRERGYFSARATADPVAFEDGDARLDIRIVPGPRASVERLAFVGVDAARLPLVRASARVEPGTPYLPGTGREARTRILDAYQDLGFRAADVQVARTIGKDGAVALGFAVSEGPQSIVTGVRIEGVQATRPAAVADAITLTPGAPAGYREAAETRNKLYGIGTFRSADVRFEPSAGGGGQLGGQVPVEAVVSLSEVRRYQLRYGVQLSDENGSVSEDVGSALGVAADVRDRNFLGRGITIGASGRYEVNLQNSRGMVFLPRYLGQRLESQLFITWQKERATDNDVTLDDTERDVTFQQRFLLRRGLEVSWAYSYNRREFHLARTGVADQPTFPGRLASLQGSLVIDRRDSPFDASRGWFHSQNLQYGLRPLGSDVSYIRYLVRQYGYLPVGPLVLASGVRWGTLGDVRGTPPLSIADLFFDAGGSQTVRGYDQDALAAVSVLGVPIGGTDLLILNQELRFPIFRWFKGAAFVDAGNTFRSLSEVSLSRLALGAGIGLRIKTPLAPFRIDVGMPIGAFGDGRPRWYFSVGQMF